MRSEAVNTQGGAPGDRPPAAATTSDVAVVAASCASASSTGAESPATPMEVALQQEQKPQNRQQDEPMTASQVTQMQNEQRRERHWRRAVHSELRDRLVAAMMEQLQRITGDPDARHLRMCASRYESFVWKKSASQLQYKQKLEHRLESLRRQPSHGENEGVEVTVRLVEGHRLNLIRSPSPALQRQPPVTAAAAAIATAAAAAAAAPALVPCPYSRHQTQHEGGYSPTGDPHRYSSRSGGRRSSSSSGSKRSGKRKMRASSSSTSSSLETDTRRDEMYFAKLRVMKSQYRDEVALVFRELCRVNTVIQHSASLRRHESNNLGDFLANLKKIIYLLEQQPGEACGMIPARKRTVEYLDVVESHIQRKVLPILHRLRHTYSTILRPIVLNYMKNSFRYNRRF
ncbi:ABC transporter protein [Phytophthora cinnamomi]|uniref:ABC transporter protein n=1 Tax=Phytophthora cinnamomi TaxID=4785 RepID=UPI00355A86EB|nr:ABC transporter protein [Phytophthora cinnamomi]